MGMAIGGSLKVVTIISVGHTTITQLGDRKWTTAIECINTYRYIILPFMIVEGKVYLSTWYSQNPDLPPDWKIAVSDNGWTNNELGVE